MLGGTPNAVTATSWNSSVVWSGVSADVIIIEERLEFLRENLVLRLRQVF